jgi:uncharacterized protein (DUF1330 family)
MNVHIEMDIVFTDPSGFTGYKQLAPLALKLFGGKYLVRGGPNETLEEGWCPRVWLS